MGEYRSKNYRPVGDAGRGKHTGKVGWLGGKHRKNDGCLGAFLMIVGVNVIAFTGAGFGIVELVSAIF